MTNYILSYFLILTLLACKSKQESIQPTVEKITESVYASGIVKSKDQYQVFSKGTGILQKLWVKKGDLVNKGQTLFTLSNDISRLNTDNARLAANNADIKTNQDKLREIQLAIDVAKKKMDNDKSILNRQQKLWADQIGTRFELEQRELAYENSKSTYESTKLRLNEMRKQLNFSTEQSRKSLSISESMQEDFNVKSEVNGRVYTILKEQGEMVSPQTPIALIGNSTTFTILLQVDENDIVKIQPGQQIFVTMDSYKGQLFEAVVDKINPLMNERSRSFDVEASFTKQPNVLYPNLTLEANIVLKTKDKALTIPRKYLINDEFVILSNNEKRNVKIGLKDYQKAEIIEGLTKDDKIVLPN